jgi:hypothetical protein
MKRFAILAAGMFAMAGAANAKCGTGQLDGNWHLYVPGVDVSEVVISNGQMTSPGSMDVFPITQTKSCKVSLTDAGLTIVGSSEAIPSSSSRKPRSIVFAVSNPIEAIFYLVRR